MAQPPLGQLLSALEAARYRFAPGDGAHVEKLLRTLDHVRYPDSASLIRFHEALMFLRAFPHTAAVLRLTELILNRFHEKVAALRDSGVNMDAFDPLEVSGISGTHMEDTLSFDVARWLLQRMPGQVEIAWDNYEPGRELGTTGPRFMPLLEDDAFVEADTPFRRWLEAASGPGPGSAAERRKSAAHGASRGYEAALIQPQRGERKALPHAHTAATAQWLIDRFDRLPLPPLQKAELYELLRIPLRWNLGNSRLSRTRNFSPTPTLSSRPSRRERSDRGEWRDPALRSIFYHSGPLINRSEVSLPHELAKRPPTFTTLSSRQGEAITNLVREVMLVRYRELYGTTLADPRSVVRTDLGRGVSIYLWNLPPDRRLPLRAYVAGFTLKNGVPINYIEAIGLCEWMEVGFNTFYTFRGGEAGWIYAQVLRCLCAWMGTTVVSVYPYQLGHDNEEAIESGAFWFYRKLGFRPGRADLRKLVEREEKKIAADPKYRTPARTLKRLAAGHLFYELPGSEVGAWDTFSTRNIGLRVNQRMAREFGGDADRMRKHSRRALERIVGIKIGSVSTSSWTPLEKAAFDNFALVLTQVPELRAGTREEKEDLVRIIRSKAKPDEMLYLHLTQRHEPLRKALLRAGHGQ
jgi:hypothetical protein